MSRKAEQNRVIQHDNKLAVEQTSIYDDSLLPPADELAKLKELDPDIINWVKKRTEIEQDARIKFNENKVKLMDKNMRQVFMHNMVCIFTSFIIILAGIACSFYFIYKGLNVEGTIFGGSTLVIASALFIRWRNKNKE